MADIAKFWEEERRGQRLLGARVRLYRRPGPLRRVPWWPTYMKHDGVIADHGGSAARRHRRGGNATTCLGPRMPPTISLRRAEFYVASAMPAPTLLWMVVFAPAVPSRVGRTPPRCARGASGMVLAVFTTLISGPFPPWETTSIWAGWGHGVVWAQRTSFGAVQWPYDRGAHSTGCDGGNRRAVRRPR